MPDKSLINDTFWYFKSVIAIITVHWTVIDLIFIASLTFWPIYFAALGVKSSKVERYGNKISIDRAEMEKLQ